MEGKHFVLIGLRVFVILCAAVVLGTTVDLHKYVSNLLSVCGAAPALKDRAICNGHGLLTMLAFGAFTGAWALIGTFIALVAIFVSFIPFILVLVWDCLTALFWFADGIALAVWNGKYSNSPAANLVPSSRLTEGQAGDAFMFLGFIATVVLIGLDFMWQRGNRKI